MTGRPLHWPCRFSRWYDHLASCGRSFQALVAKLREGYAHVPAHLGGQVRTYSILNYVPTSLLITVSRTRSGLRWGIPAMLLAIRYLLAVYWCGTTIEAGGPG